MLKLVLLSLLVVASPLLAFGQQIDKPPTLGIELDSFTPFSYKTEDGFTVVVGEVENKKNFPVTGVKIWVGFYDEVNPQPLESTVGTTLLEVIPPHAKSPYLIKSPTANMEIQTVSVNLLGFNSAPEKETALEIESNSLQVSEQIQLDGKILNTSNSSSTNTQVHVVFYDNFVPPRVIRVYSLDLGEIEANSSQTFSLNEMMLSNLSKLQLYAESDNFASKEFEIKVTPPELMSNKIDIKDISMTDSSGERLSSVKAGSTVYFESVISSQGITDTFNLPYIYYVQVMQTREINDQTKSFVEFIGTFEGVFDEEGTQKPIVEWSPQKPGLYFVETYVWDPRGVALSSPGPIILVLVN